MSSHEITEDMREAARNLVSAAKNLDLAIENCVDKGLIINVAVAHDNGSEVDTLHKVTEFSVFVERLTVIAESQPSDRQER